VDEEHAGPGSTMRGNPGTVPGAVAPKIRRERWKIGARQTSFRFRKRFARISPRLHGPAPDVRAYPAAVRPAASREVATVKTIPATKSRIAAAPPSPPHRRSPTT